MISQMKNVKTLKTMNHSAVAEQGTSPGSVPALDRTLDIIELLSSSSTALTLSQLSSRLGYPMNAVFRITQTLLARGYLARDAQTLAFRLTPRMLRLSTPHWGNLSLPAISRDAMIWLAGESRETVQLGVLSDLEGIIVDQVEGPQPLRIVVDLGLRFPLHNNAPGKLLLAHLPAQEQEQVMGRIELTPSTPTTITTLSDLRRECKRIVSDGYSTDFAEADEGIHCVAGAIRDGAQRVVGTLWITGPAKRLPKAKFRELGMLVKAAGDRISRRIGEMT